MIEKDSVDRGSCPDDDNRSSKPGENMVERLAGGEFLGRLVRRRAVGGLSLSETRYAPGTSLPRHSHEYGYFCLVRRGTYREEYGGRQRWCGPQTFAYHPPGELHAEHIG